MNTTGFVYSSPTVSADGSTVFFGPSGDATVHAINAATGVPVWKHLEHGQSTKSAGGALSPDGKLLFVVGKDGSNSNTIVKALSTSDGTPVWDPNARPWRGAVGSSTIPAALTVDGAGQVWVANGKGALFSFDPASGNVTNNCTGDAFGTLGYSGGVAIARDGLLILVDDTGSITAVGV